MTADEVAEARRVHRNVARSRLERLVRAGLLVPDYERRSGRTGPGAGRPAKVYAVAPEVEALEFPGGRYERLIGALVDALPATNRRKRLRKLGVALGEELAGSSKMVRATSFRAAAERLCGVMRRLGYQAALVEVGDQDAVVATATCPLRPLVRSRPELAELDRGMWAGVLAGSFRGASVGQLECETQDCSRADSDCRVRLGLRSS